MTPPPASSDETPTADFARPVLERQLAELSTLADIGMEIAEGLRRLVAQATEPEAEPVDPVAVTLAFSRVSRAVRLTFALQTEVIDKLRGVGRIEDYEARLASRDAAPAPAAVDVEEQRLRARKDDIAATVTGIIDEKHKGAEGGEAHERCIREATERLKDADDLGDILARPFDEIIAQICRDLGLSSQGREGGVHSKSPFPRTGREAEARSRQQGSGVRVAPLPANAASDEVHGGPADVQPAYSPHAEPPPPPIPAVGFASASQSPIQGERVLEYTPPRDADALPGYPVGLPGELPPRGRRPQRPPTNYTHGFD